MLLGLPSSGLHTNGYSLVRKLFFEREKLQPDSQVADLGKTVAEELLTPHRNYLPAIRGLLQADDLHALAHVTGGGITNNLARVLPPGLDAVVQKGTWEILPIFRFVRERGKVADPEMYRTFNMGLGMILVVAPDRPGPSTGFPAIPGDNLLRDRTNHGRPGKGALPVKNVGILLSGRGSNFLALVDAIDSGQVPARVVLVLSNRPDAAGLHRARQRGYPSVCVSSIGLDREIYDRLVVAELQAAGVEIVCLAGFMRLLSPWFVQQYPLRILNIHPSLLPAFPGLHAQRQALEWGVKVTGCTVHFVDEQLDHGPIIVQETVPVCEGDSEEALSQRILRQEHRIYPKALRFVCSNRLRVKRRTVVVLPPTT